MVGGGGGGGEREEETKKRRKNERERESVCMQTERESACGLLSGYDVCLCTSMYVHACVHVHLCFLEGGREQGGCYKYDASRALIL